MASANPTCAGSPVTFTATPVNGGSSPVYEWRVNNRRVGTNSPVYTYTPLANDVVFCKITSNQSCVTGNPSISNSITMTLNQVVTVSVSISASANSVCSGTDVTYTAVPVNGGPLPTYQWKVNSLEVPGATNATFTNSPVNNDAVICLLGSSLNCPSVNPAISNTVTMTVFPIKTVSVTISADHETVCEGSSVTLTAVPVNGGVSPAYQWQVNGADLSGATNATFTLIPVNNNAITCVLTSSETVCVADNPATSNEVIITVNENLLVELFIEPSANPVCEGTQVTYNTFAMNEGTSPVYQWVVNSFVVPGATSSTFTHTPSDFNTVSCVLTSSETCTTNNPAHTDTIVMNVFPVLPVSVTISASANPAVEGTPVTFTADPVNGGYVPVFNWFVNSLSVGAYSSAYTYVPTDGDEVYCVLTSNEPCQSGSPATSNTITMSVTAVADTTNIPTVVIHDQEVVCYDALKVIYVGAPESFTVENGGSVTMIAGEKIIYRPGTIINEGGYMHGYISTTFCGMQSQPLVAVVTGDGKVPFSAESLAFRIYPNPTNSNFTLEQKDGIDYSNFKVEIYSMQGARIIDEVIIGQKKHEFMFNDVPGGIYFVKVIAGDHVETIKLVKNR